MATTPSGLMIQRQGDVHVVEFMESNVLDQVRIEQIRAELDQLVDRAGVPKIVLSFENVGHISSAVIGVLMSVDKKVKAKKGQLRLASISPSIMQVFKITRLDRVLKIYNDTESALVKF